MLRIFVSAIAFFYLFSASANTVKALHQRSLLCRKSSEVKKTLEKKWGEHPVASGLAGEGNFAFVWYANPAKGTWTIVRFTSRGLACIIAVGDGFGLFLPEKPKREERKARE